MAYEWGVDRLTGLGRTFEALSLAEANLSHLDSRVKELDDWDNQLPVDEVQAVRETAARIRPLRDDLVKIFSDLGDRIHMSPWICDERIESEMPLNGKLTLLAPVGQFNRKDLAQTTSKLVTVLAKAEIIAAELCRQAQILVKAMYPEYQIAANETAVMPGYPCGDTMGVQDLGDSEGPSHLSETVQDLVNYCIEDGHRIWKLRSLVEEEMRSPPAKAVKHSKHSW
ncbi:hypothetical protein [Planctellipticum variicoloris]|uniref:hypothetical protein n=1 Tax=Planctellipticum variicoloris TaxID=3064265 RepID=UPI0030135206|nr:hypothetical protein SH412_004847 [Planctomycetaceae bacterium SH412]